MKKITLYFSFFLILFFTLFVYGRVYRYDLRENVVNNSLRGSKSDAPELSLLSYLNFSPTRINNFYYYFDDSVPFYSEDFEGNHNWTFVNDGTNKWYVGEAVSNGTGTKALYISNDDGVSYEYTTDGIQVSHAYKDIDIPEGTNDISIDFDWKCMGETTSFDRFRIWVVPNTLVPVAGTELLASAENIQIGRPNYNGNDSFLRENLIVDATPYAGTTVRVVFEWRNDFVGGTQPPAAIDNIEVSVITCSAPNSLILNEVNSNSLTVGWSAPSGGASGYELFYSENDTSPAADTIPSINSITTTSQEITGLESNTEYFVWVRSVCEGEDRSNWVGPLTVQTTCDAITVLPFVETFSTTSTTKSCWAVIDGNDDGKTWDLDYSSNMFIGDRVAVINTDLNSGNNDDWLISPTIVLTGNQRLKYHYRVQSASEPNDFRVMLSTSGPVPENFTEEIVPLAAYDNIDYIEKTVNLLDANGDPYTGEVNIAWHVPPGDLDGWRVYVDNVIIEDIPSCPDPSNIILSNVSETEATIGWTVGFNETQWEVFVQPAGTGVPTTNGISTTTNPYTISTLDHSTRYEVYVRAVCGEDDKSNWIGPVSFTTTQIPVQLPYAEDFEGSVGFSFNNDLANAWVIGTAVHNGQGAKSMYISKDNGVSYEYNITSSSVSHAYRDIAIPENTQEISISFDWRGMGESTIDRFRVWLVPLSFNPEAGTQITEGEAERVQVGQANYSLNNEFLRENIVADVSDFAGQNMRLVFEWRNDGSIGTQPPAAIDNLNVAVITCSAPSNISVGEVTENSIGISWTAPLNAGNGTSYDIFLATTNQAPNEDSVPTHTSTDTTFTFDNLTPNTEYYIWIRTNCNADGTSFWIGPLNVRTAQIPEQLPYIEDFEGEINWSFIGGVNNWVVGTAVSNGGTHSLYVSKNEGLTHEYDINSASVSHAYRDFFIEDLSGELSIEFDWICEGYEFFGFKDDYFNVWLLPSSYIPVSGVQIETTNHNGYKIVDGYLNNDTFLTEHIVFDLDENFDNDSISGNFRIVFEWINSTLANVANLPAAIDNLKIEKVTCPSVLNPTSEINEETGDALLTWEPRGEETQWEVYIIPIEGEEPNADSVGIIVDEPQYVFQDGDPEMFYKFFVRPICSEEDKGLWSVPGIISFVKPPGCAQIDVDLEVTELDLTSNDKGDYIICLDEPVHVNLDATYYDIPTTTSYTVEAIDYRPPFPFLGGIEMPITSDDDYTASFELPFQFCFFGNSYDFCRVGDNGVITFGLPYTETYGEFCPYSFNQQIPNATFPIRNAIYGVFQDMLTTNNPGENSVINYQVIGKYPCRTFVVNFNEIPAFSCSEEEYRTTTQMVLYEITNIIEIYVKKRTACEDWNDGNGVIGIQNEDGTLAYTPPERNTGAWEAIEEAWRFSPSGESSVQFVWQKDGEFFSNDTSIDVIVDESVRYSAVATYEGCEEVVEVIKDFNFIKDNFDIGTPKIIEDCTRNPDELNRFNLRENDELVLNGLDSANYSVEYFLNESDLEEGINPLPDVYETSDPAGAIYVKLTNLTTGCFKTASFPLVVLPPLKVTELDNYSVCDSFELPILKEGEAYYTEPYGEGKKYEGGDVFNEIDVHTIYIYKKTEVGCIGQSEFTLEVVESPVLDVIEDQLLSCETFKLPIPSDNNTYFTEAEGNGIELEPGEEIIFPTTIYIYAKKEGTLGAVCIKEGSFRVDYEECPIPKGISPNGDEKNNSLDLTNYGISDIKIYNRFGVEVYSHGLGYTNQWHGQDKSGENLPDGTYYYVLISHGKVRSGWVQINK